MEASPTNSGLTLHAPTLTNNLKRSHEILDIQSPPFVKIMYEKGPKLFYDFLNTFETSVVQECATYQFQDNEFFPVVLEEPRMKTPEILGNLLCEAIVFRGNLRNIKLMATTLKKTLDDSEKATQHSKEVIEVIETAIKYSQLDMVKLLMNIFFVNKIQQEDINEMFLLWAILTVKEEIVEYFLDCTHFSERILWDAVNSNHLPTIQLVLNSPHARPNDIIREAMENEDILQMLIDHPRSHKETLLNECIQTGQDLSFIEKLIHKNTDYLKNFQLPLRLACQQNRSKIVEYLLKLPGSNPQVDYSQCLRIAAQNGNTETVRVLLMDGRSCVSVFQNEPLNKACQQGHTEVVRLLMEQVDPNQGSENCFPIQCATYYGHTKVVEVLLKDIRLDPQDCIITAAERGSVDMIAMFVQHPNQSKEHQPAALEAACTRGNLSMIQILLKNGTKITQRSLKLAVRHVNLLCVQMFLNQTNNLDISVEKQTNNLDISVENYMKIFAEAVRVSSVEIIQILIEHPFFDPTKLESETIQKIVHRHLKTVIETIFSRTETTFANTETTFAKTVNYEILHEFISRAVDIEQIDILESLIQLYIKAPKTEDHWNPLTQAIFQRRPISVDFLVNQVEPEGDQYEFLHSMIVMNHISQVETLFKNPSLDPKLMRDKCLPTAICLNLVDIVNLFFENRFRGLSINPRHLILACKWGHTKIVETLLALGHDPSYEDNEALILASQHGHAMVVHRLLRDHRVNPAARESIAIVKAAEQGHLDVVEILLDDRRIDAATMKCALYKLAKENSWDHVAAMVPKPEEDFEALC